jgi:hypothetical protein
MRIYDGMIKRLSIFLFLMMNVRGVFASDFVESHHEVAARAAPIGEHAENVVPVEPYTYDTKLDIARIVSISDVSGRCGVVPLRLTYEDSKGMRHAIEYQVVSSSCDSD